MLVAGHAGDAGAGRRARPTRNEHRQDEPYRRALIGMYARLAATLQALTGTEALRHAVAPQNPYASAARTSWPTCASSSASLQAAPLRRRWSARGCSR